MVTHNGIQTFFISFKCGQVKKLYEKLDRFVALRRGRSLLSLGGLGVVIKFALNYLFNHALRISVVGQYLLDP